MEQKNVTKIITTAVVGGKEIPQ